MRTLPGLGTSVAPSSPTAVRAMRSTGGRVLATTSFGGATIRADGPCGRDMRAGRGSDAAGELSGPSTIAASSIVSPFDGIAALGGPSVRTSPSGARTVTVSAAGMSRTVRDPAGDVVGGASMDAWAIRRPAVSRAPRCGPKLMRAATAPIRINAAPQTAYGHLLRRPAPATLSGSSVGD